MGRLTLIILVLFSATAIYSEASASPGASASNSGKTLHGRTQGFRAQEPHLP
ncbi:hypothetical protein [Thiohalophilus sp.]|uniref:hypothetical protein n=1 Tax=Thiohalophilus sp. TaxID=3028392 RepID=UPI0039757AA2